MDELEKLKMEFEHADEYIEEIRLRTNRYWREHKYPTDPAKWLDRLEEKLKIKLRDRTIKKMPDDAAGDILELLAEQLQLARNEMRKGDEVNLKINLMLLDENWERLIINKSFYSGKTYSSGQSIKGKIGAKVLHEGKELIKEIILDFAKRKDVLGAPIPADELWGELFGRLDDKGAEPEEVPHRIKDYESIKYRNPDTGGDEKIEYQTFRDNLKEFRKNKIQLKK